MLDIAAGGDLIAGFMLIVGRLSLVIFLMPGVGEQLIPVRVRLSILLLLAFALSLLDPDRSVSFTPFSNYAGLLIVEIAIGFVLGVMLRMSIWMLTIAGTVIAQSIGLAQFLGVALEMEQQTLFANLLALAGATIFLSIDAHVQVFAALIRLYDIIPIAGWSEFDFEMALGIFFRAFVQAILLAWPFVVANLLYNICLGFINKALPQLMVAFVGAPFIVGAGILLLVISMTSLLLSWKDMALQLVGWI